eukprot:4499368-Prymnesium_polylepis.2
MARSAEVTMPHHAPRSPPFKPSFSSLFRDPPPPARSRLARKLALSVSPTLCWRYDFKNFSMSGLSIRQNLMLLTCHLARSCAACAGRDLRLRSCDLRGSAWSYSSRECIAHDQLFGLLTDLRTRVRA